MKKGPLIKRNDVYSLSIPEGETYASILETYPEIVNIPYEKQSLGMLRQACIHVGIQPHASRAIMISRLNNQERALTVTMTKRIHQKAPTEFYVNHQQNTQRLPHEVVRIIFSYTDIPTLFSALYSCKYLHESALYCLRLRACQTFNSPNATPMALSLWLVYENRPKTFYRQFFNIQLSSANIDLTPCITSLIVKYGSIEGLAAENLRKKTVEQTKKAERKEILQTAQSRFDECVEMLAKHNLPLLLVMDNGEAKNTDLLECVNIMCRRTYHFYEFMKMCKKYINKHHPYTLAYARKRLDSHVKKHNIISRKFSMAKMFHPYVQQPAVVGKHYWLWYKILYHFMKILKRITQYFGLSQANVDRHAQHIAKIVLQNVTRKLSNNDWWKNIIPLWIGLVVYKKFTDTFDFFFSEDDHFSFCSTLGSVFTNLHAIPCVYDENFFIGDFSIGRERVYPSDAYLHDVPLSRGMHLLVLYDAPNYEPSFELQRFQLK